MEPPPVHLLQRHRHIVQRAAEAYWPAAEGQKQCLADVKYYMENAHIIRDGLTKAGFTVYGATNSRYMPGYRRRTA